MLAIRAARPSSAATSEQGARSLDVVHALGPILLLDLDLELPSLEPCAMSQAQAPDVLS